MMRNAAGFFVRRLPAILVSIAALTVIGWAITTALDRQAERDAERERAEFLATPREEVFTYTSVEFSHVDPEGLWMNSTVVWLWELDRVQWSDVLRCEVDEGAGGRLPIFSTQMTSAVSVGPDYLVDSPWAYLSGYPRDGRVCIMVSTITVEKDGGVWVQEIESSPFRPGAPRP